MSDQPHGSGLAPGAMVDHFRIVRLLGRGGMGEVYLARDTRLGRKVALKLIHGRLVGSAAARQRLLYEAQATASFSHPHIVTIHEVGEHEGSPYFALEYLEGETLRDRMRERPGVPAALRMGLAIAEALAEAHQKGILHRDLKPENVLVPSDGRLRVVDFGLAQPLAPLGGPAAEATPAPVDEDDGFFHGTPGYVSPELWNEQEVGAASDVWALGIMLYELAYGHHPYAGYGVTALGGAVGSSERVPRPREIGAPLPEGLAELIDECLAKDPAARPSATQVARRVEQILAGGARKPGDEESPFRGLMPFTERHAERFFGRELEVAEALERLRAEPVLPIIGPSGAGKSSFVRAGLVPRLREQETWRVILLRPGTQPIDALARAVAGGGRQTRGASTGGDTQDSQPTPVDATPPPEPVAASSDELAGELRATPRRLSLHLRRLADETGARILLVVDQLEELFTHDLGEETRRAFIEALFTAADDPADPVRVCFTLRDDFVGRAAEGPLARRVLAHVLVLRSPGPEALAEILTRPLSATGYGYDDPALVPEMIAAVAAEPACLPLLQFTTRLLWERRDRERRRLLRAAYLAIGGVGGALAAHADAVLGALPERDVRHVRSLLVRLVTPERTRRVLPRAALLEGLPDDAAGVLAQLTRVRLLSVRKVPGEEEGELELAHESLIHSWRTLARWLDEGREELVFLDDLRRAAALWEKRGRRPAEVWRDEALREARRLEARLERPLPPALALFLAAGEALDRRALARRRALVAGTIGLLALIAAGASAAAIIIADKERHARAQEAEARRRFAEAQLEGARAALLRGELVEARAKLRGSLEAEDSPLGRALWWSASLDPLVWRKTLSSSSYAIAYAPDGSAVAAGCQDGTISLVDVDTQAVRVLRDTDQVTALAFTADGRHLLTGSWSRDARLWDLASGERRLLVGHGAGIWGTAASADGRLWATASYDRTLRVWPAQGNADPVVLPGHGAQINGVAFAPTADELASVGWDGTLRLWDARGAPRRSVQVSSLPLYSVAYHPGGSELATVGVDGWVRTFDAAGTPRTAFPAHDKPVQWLRFNHDGTLLATASDDKTVRLWDYPPRGGPPRAILGGHGDRAIGAVFSPDGTRLATADYAGLVQLWWVERALAAAAGHRGHTAPAVGLSFSPDGKRMASASYDQTARLWDPESGAELTRLTGHTHRVFSIDLTDDQVVTSGQDATVRLWDPRTGAELRTLAGHRATIYEVFFSPDGKRVLSGSGDGTARLWDAATGATLQVLRGHTDAVISVAFAPDGRTLATGSSDTQIRLWSATSGAQLAILTGHEDTVQGLAFSPDGERLLSGSEDKTIRLWDWRRGGRGEVIGRHDGRVYQIAWHPDGKLVGSASSDHTARLWTLGGAMRVLRGHRGEVNNIEFHPDGRRVATVSDDTTVRVWDVDSGRPVWRAPLLAAAGPTLYTHAGWRRLSLDRAEPATLPASAWRRLVEADAAHAVMSDDAGWVCVLTGAGALELWEVAADRRAFRADAAWVTDLRALPGGCVTLGGGAAHLWRAEDALAEDGRARPLVPRSDTGLVPDASALGGDVDSILIATAHEVLAFDGGGGLVDRQRGSSGVTAIARSGDRLLVGFRNGSIERLAGGALPFEGVPNAPVVRLVAGPSGTVGAGFGNGMVGVWQIESGARLESRRLRGPVTHLVLVGPRLYAASDLGDHTGLDLEAFHLPRCDVLARVWHDIPVVWESGAPVRRPVPAHACAP